MPPGDRTLSKKKPMNHNDHVGLIQDGVHRPDGVWADFGSGRGAFTLALADLLNPGAQIYSIDLDSSVLGAQRKTMEARFPHITVHYQQADFSKKLALPALDGIMMANSLHFLRDKGPTLRLIRDYLKEDGRLILVEYNTDRGNRWVPYPLSFSTWERLAEQHGFSHTRLLQRKSSSFLDEFFSACSEKGIVDGG